MRSGTSDLAGLAELLALGVDAQAGGEELGLQRVRPAAVGQRLLRRLGGEAGDEAVSGGIGRGSLRELEQQRHRAVVDELDLHIAPNTPRCAPRRSQKRSYSGSASSGGAAAT